MLKDKFSDICHIIYLTDYYKVLDANNIVLIEEVACLILTIHLLNNLLLKLGRSSSNMVI
jgi:hypothetical protein